jgi:competence protein ComEC
MNFKSKKAKWVITIFSVLILANLIAGLEFYDLYFKNPLEVSFFDVGQGDSIFIETQNGNQVLIDGGPDSTVLNCLAKEMPFYDRDIDLVILTHPDSDHLTGLLDVLKRYNVKNIVWNDYKKESPQFSEWQKLIKEERAEIKIAEPGDRIIISENPYIFMDVVYSSNSSQIDSNDSSIISRLVFANDSFLFMGDATHKVEENLSSGIKSDIIKIGHHGSKDSTSLKLLELSQPKEAIISVGKNNYGHPSLEILERLRNSGIEVLTTKESGTIKFVSDGKI